MSWLFSQALMKACANSPYSQERAAGYSAGTSSAGELSAPWSVMFTEHSFSRRGKTMGSSGLSPSGQTCAVLTADRGAELLTLYLEAFRAPTSAQQDSEPESKEANPACGRKWPGSLAMFDRGTSSWKTPQCSLLADSEPFSETWPRSGLMLAGACSELPPLASRISESACGFSLPTPSGVNGGRNNMMGRIDEWGGSSNPLRGTVIGSMCLPEFEEMVMGWPIGWTELTPYETGRFHEWQRLHGAS